MKTVFVVLLCVASSPVCAGEWLKTIRFKGGIGAEYVESYRSDNGIGDAPLFKVGIEQAIYTTDNVSAYAEGFHISSGKNQAREERPVNYLGVGIEAKFDWY